MKDAGSSVEILLVTISIVLPSALMIVVTLWAWHVHKASRAASSSRYRQLSVTWAEIRTMTTRLADEPELSEGDIEELQRAARALPDLDFPDSVSRQRRRRTEQTLSA
jgi:hypothetical protein